MNLFKNTLVPLLFVVIAWFSVGQAQAAIISIETDKQQYQVGEKITAFLKVSQADVLLSGFFLALQYQHSALAVLQWGYGNSFDDGFGSYQFGEHDLANGRLSVEDYADWAADQSLLAALQSGGFLLATVEFQALVGGQLSLSLDPTYLGLLTFDGELRQPSWAGADITVIDKPHAVPAAPVLVLMLGGLLGMLAQRRQQTSI